MISSEPALNGTIRIDERIPRLSARLEPGEIAVIEFPDLDRSSALSLLSQRPLAVLNAASSTTGRKASLGARLLVEAGVVVVDDLGSDLMTLAEGEAIEIRGGEIYQGGQLIAAGQRRDLSELREQQSDGRERLDTGIQAFAQGAALAWQSESALLLDGVGIPGVATLRSRSKKSRTVLVISPGQKTASELKALRRFVRDFSPGIIAVAEAANQVSLLGRKPDVIVGDLSSVREKLLRSGAQLVLLERPDGSVLGSERAANYGLSYRTVATSASATDIAILLADANEAEQIVTVGQRSGIAEFLDRSTAEVTAGFFIDLRCQDKVVASSVVSAMYRPGISSLQLLCLLVAALVVFAAAILFTPWGSDLGFQVTDWFSGLWSAGGAGGSTAASLGIFPTI